LTCGEVEDRVQVLGGSWFARGISMEWQPLFVPAYLEIWNVNLSLSEQIIQV